MKHRNFAEIDQVEDLKKEIEQLRQKIKELNDNNLHSNGNPAIDRPDYKPNAVRKKIERKIYCQLKFCEENPNPVLRVYETGRILYFNRVSSDLMRIWNCEVGEYIPEPWRGIIDESLATGIQKIHEVQCNQKTYSFVIVPVINSKYVNLYGRDITEEKRVEESLRESEEKFSLAFRSNPNALVLSRIDDGVFLDINDAFLTLFERTRDEVIGKTSVSLNMIANPEDRDKVLAMLREKGRVVNHEIRIKRQSGEERVAFLSIELLHFNQGRAMLTTLQDITERKQAELKISEQAHLIASITETIPDMISVIELPNRKILYTNREPFRLQGFNTEDLLKMTLEERNELVHPDDRPALFNYYNILAKRENNEVAEVVYRTKTKGDEWMWFRTRGRVFGRDDNGKVKSCINITQNIMEQKIAEKKIHENEQRLQGVFSNVALGIAEIDNEERLMNVNNQLYHILGYPYGELEGKSVSELTAPEDRLLCEEMNARLFRGEFNSFEQEKRYLKKDGSPIWVHVTVAAIRNSEGNFIKSIGTLEDISERKKVEQALKESEERFRTLADNISQIAWIADSQGKVQWYNKRWHDYTGVSLEEMQNGHRYNVHHPDYAEQVLNSFYESVNTGKPWENIYPLRGKDGQFRWFLARALPIRDENMNITFWFGTNTDITVQRQREETLRKSEQRLQGMFDNAAIGIVEVDEQDRFIAVNERICDILGYTREMLLGKSVYDITAPEDLSICHEVNMKLHTGKLDVFDYEKRYIKRDGSYLWVHVSLSAVRDLAGRHVRTIRTIEDISARKKAEELLRESEEKFRSLFENISEGVALHEIVYENNNPVNYRIIDVNPAYYVNCGISKTELIGVLATELYETTEPPYFNEYLEVERTGKPFRFETFFNKFDKYFIVDVISPRKGQFATVYEEITELKNYERELKQKNDDLTRFTYTVSHDLKSPLVTIKMFTSYLRDDINNQDKAAQEEDINFIENAADSMGRLLDDLLELSRIGRKEEPKEEILLETIVQLTIDLVAGQIRERNVKVFNTAPPILLYGYHQRFIQLYQNLIDNAVKFMSNQADPQIEIGAFIDKAKSKQVILFVADNGSGIESQYHEKVFNLFDKLDPTSIGTGIGLAWVKRIVEVHQGQIWFTSEGANKGTTFYFTLEGTKMIN